MYNQYSAKIYAWDQMIKHLNNAVKNDKRKREHLRAQIALRTLDKWYREGLRRYDI